MFFYYLCIPAKKKICSGCRQCNKLQLKQLKVLPLIHAGYLELQHSQKSCSCTSLTHTVTNCLMLRRKCSVLRCRLFQYLSSHTLHSVFTLQAEFQRNTINHASFKYRTVKCPDDFSLILSVSNTTYLKMRSCFWKRKQ